LKIILVLSLLLSFAFATDRQDYEEEAQPETRLEKINKKIQKNEELLNDIPKQLERMKKRQEYIQRLVKNQRNMVQSFMEGRAICKVQKLQNEKAGMIGSEVQRLYKGCKSIIKDLDRSEFAQIQKDIKYVREKIENEIDDLRYKTGQKMVYEAVLKSLYNMRETVKDLDKTMEEVNNE
jgi:archaellum component FlaC